MASKTPTPTWSDVFRRSRSENGTWYVKPRHVRAVHAIVREAAHGKSYLYRGSMVGYAGEEWSWSALDGGLFELGGVWSGPNGTWLSGQRLRRFVLYRLGVAQPRRSPGEGAVPSLQALEEEVVRLSSPDHRRAVGALIAAARASDPTDLVALMAEGAGIPSTLTVETADQLDRAARFLVEAPAPRFLLVRVMPGPSSSYKRNWDLVEGRLKFRNAYLERQNRA